MTAVYTDGVANDSFESNEEYGNASYINKAFTKEEIDEDINRNKIRRQFSADDITRRPSLAKSTSSRGSRTISNRLSQFTALKYIQKFTQQQISQLEKFSSVNYFPSHSHLYLHWLKQFSQRLNWDKWFLLTLIAILIGLLAAFLKQCLQFFNNVRWDKAKEYANEDNIAMAWVWNSSIGITFVLIASFLVVFVHQPAVGSGVPEVISYLNGVTVHGVFSLKNFIVKFIALIFAVSSGLPTATQGPMVALGAIIGGGVGQFKSESCGFKPTWFSRFRNAEDRRTFTTAGVAAGIAAAFNAPIGGLLFAMEDLTSFWSKKLCWQTFFCCGIAACVANTINTAFNAFEYRGYFGLFSLSITEPIQIHILSLVPAVAIGIIGGLLGALFTRLNAWMVQTRKYLLAKIKNKYCQGAVRMAEVIVLVLIMSTTTTLLPLAFDCTVGEEYPNDTEHLRQCGFEEDFERESYHCLGNVTEGYVEYSEVATLMQGSGTTFLEKLTSRGTHRWFGYDTLLTILPIWFFMTIWTLGSAIAGGIFVPNLVSGALYGRAIGLGLVDFYAYLNPEYIWDTPIGDPMWEWLDPGVIAVIGSASLLGGVTRLNLAVTVIVVEMSHDLDLTVPVLITIWTAKITADIFSKPLYNYQLDGKALPYLDQDPTVIIEDEVANLELYEARDVMSTPVLSIKSTESLHILSNILLRTSHSGFPIVTYDEETRHEHAVGLITRTELSVLLTSEDVLHENKPGAIVYPDVEFEKMSVDYLADQAAVLERLSMYTTSPIYQSIFLNLDAYMNRSVCKVDQYFSLYRTYQVFRSLGLRHLLVVDKANRMVGMITRKDLMPFNIEQKINALIEQEDPFESTGDSPRDDSQEIVLPSTTMKLRHEFILEEDEDSHSSGSVKDQPELGSVATTKF